MYDQINLGFKKEPVLFQKVIENCVKCKLDNFYKTGEYTHTIYDNLVFNKVKEKFGGRLRFILCGSAPINKSILDFIKIVLSSWVVEGYGQTESCACSLLANVTDPMTGHLGGPSGPFLAKVIDVPELGYFSTDINPVTKQPEPKGELCFKGAALFSGYFNDEENTKLSLDKDGWLHSGDIGLIMTDKGNAFKVIDRRKTIFKTSQGEYIVPDKIENALNGCSYASQIFIYGKSQFSYIIAIIVPNVNKCEEFLKMKNINFSSIYESQELIQEILDSLNTIGRTNNLKGFEIPKKIILSKIPFTIDNNMLSPTLKKKQKEIVKFFEDQINKLY